MITTKNGDEYTGAYKAIKVDIMLKDGKGDKGCTGWLSIQLWKLNLRKAWFYSFQERIFRAVSLEFSFFRLKRIFKWKELLWNF